MAKSEYQDEITISALGRKRIAEKKALHAYLVQVAQTGENSPEAIKLKQRLQQIQQAQ